MTPHKEDLKKLVVEWFESSLDLLFVLRRGREKLLCKFESDAWYEHINDESGITIRSIRHGGDCRRLAACHINTSNSTQITSRNPF